MQQITGSAVALINKYVRFDPHHPEKTEAHEFCLVAPSALDKDGKLRDVWGEDSVYVGRAEITITLLPPQDMTSHALVALRRQKDRVQAEAAARITHIDAQIQSLLAITNEA